MVPRQCATVHTHAVRSNSQLPHSHCFVCPTEHVPLSAHPIHRRKIVGFRKALKAVILRPLLAAGREPFRRSLSSRRSRRPPGTRRLRTTSTRSHQGDDQPPRRPARQPNLRHPRSRTWALPPLASTIAYFTDECRRPHRHVRMRTSRACIRSSRADRHHRLAAPIRPGAQHSRIGSPPRSAGLLG